MLLEVSLKSTKSGPKLPLLLKRKQTWVKSQISVLNFVELEKFSRSCLSFYSLGVVSGSMRHSSCWFPLIAALREHPSPSHTHTQSHIHVAAQERGATNNRETHFLPTLTAHTWNLPAPEPADVCQVCDRAPDVSSLMTNRPVRKPPTCCFLLWLGTCGGHIQSSRTTETSDAITDQGYLLSLWRFPAQ